MPDKVSGQAGTERQKRFTILGLGDSITEGGEDFSSYLYPLWEKLFSGGYLVHFIGPKKQQCRIGELAHAGYSGKPVEFLDSIIDQVYTDYPADIVLIHAGHNHFAEELPVKGMIASYQSIIKKIRKINPSATILMAQVIQSGKLPKYSYIPELNTEIAKMVKELNDPQIVLTDQAASFDWRMHSIEDKVHPNREGAARMAEVWYDALSVILPTPVESFEPEIKAYKVIGRDTMKMHVFRPEVNNKGNKCPAIVYFFGGGWKLGTPLQFYRECAYYASKGMVAITVDYRIASLHQTKPDDSLDDAKDAMCWIRKHGEMLGVDTARIVASGASAGAYLAAAMGVSPGSNTLCYYPNLLVLNYPVLERIKELGDSLPPILFMVGSEDPLVPLSSVYDFQKQVEQRNGIFDLHVFEGAGHPIFYYREDLNETFYDVRKITDGFLTQYGYLRNSLNFP